SIDPETGYAGFTDFAFTNETVDYGTGTGETFAWDFGDGNSSVEENPTHLYAADGTYTVTFTVTTTHGSNSVTQDLEVLATELPDLQFSVDPATGYAGFTDFAFTNATVDYGTGTDATFAWDFGDGESSDLENPTHLYAVAGTYTVTFTVTTTHGSNSVTQDLEVLEPVAPTASFTADPTLGYLPLEVTFTNTSDLGTGELVSYLWDFGNGDISAEENPVYTYTYTGDFLASLTVTTTHGDNTSGFVTITAEELLNVTIDLAQNWQWISLNILPVEPAIDAIFGGNADLGMVIDGSGNLYIPPETNEIGDWDIYSGYAVGMRGTGQISVDGEYLDPATPIDIVSGWNFVSYFPNQAINVDEALATIDGEDLAIVKSDDGYYYVPSLGINSLGIMEPTKGYKIGYWADATLVYPESPVAKLTQQTIVTEPVHFQMDRRYGDSHAVLILTENLNNLSLEIGDEIGLFSDNMCVGASVYEGEEYTAVAAWKSENGDAGYHDGEKISVKVFSGGNEIEIATAESAYFGEGFFSVVELTSAIIVSDFALHGNYPNPFNPSTKIVFDVSATADIDLTIYNIIGQEVRSLQNGQLDHGSYQITWDGLDNSGNMVSSGVYFYRMTWTTEEISGQETQKMVLLR
ncbi:MAG: PKD domain-containing protein, partial [Candidatus Marinimicrobia bacterium]|nr:PKD domain-containing protein [Candidatus Neomarinimicrobiota bacterium]